MMIVLLLFLQKQNLANAIYLFGLGTLLILDRANRNAGTREEGEPGSQCVSRHAPLQLLTPWGVIASFDRVYTSSSAPQCERKGPPY
jgi:hypothetical protein